MDYKKKICHTNKRQIIMSKVLYFRIHNDESTLKPYDGVDRKVRLVLGAYVCL